MPAKIEIKAEQYLVYLDKEMSIMGVLSTFCLAVTGLFFERAMSAGRDSIMYVRLTSIVSAGSAYFIVASVLILTAAAFFYKQRSLLAWYYGQIALEMTLPDYTDRRVETWLKDADSWEAWIPYNCAFWTLVFAILEFVLGIVSVYVTPVPTHAWGFALVLVPLLILLLVWVRRNSIKFRFLEELPYFRIK